MFDLSFHKTPKVISSIFPKFLWKVNTTNKEVYLTFDDGPIPQLTNEILTILRTYNVKATFFCVGENVHKYPDLYQQLISEGHSTGNHTYNHIKAWKVSHDDYLRNILLADQVMVNEESSKKRLFRPPYGQFTPKLYNSLVEYGYKIVMWDILTKDYLKTLNVKKALEICLEKTEKGSVIVFHDNLKARNNVLNLLPMYIKEILNKGYKFSTL